jgi:hypothetical protein
MTRMLCLEINPTRICLSRLLLPLFSNIGRSIFKHYRARDLVLNMPNFLTCVGVLGILA